MRLRVLAVFLLAAAAAPGAAAPLCVNGTCDEAGPLQGNVLIGPDKVTVQGGLDPSPTVGQTGIILDAGTPAVRVLVNGTQVCQVSVTLFSPGSVATNVCGIPIGRTGVSQSGTMFQVYANGDNLCAVGTFNTPHGAGIAVCFDNVEDTGVGNNGSRLVLYINGVCITGLQISPFDVGCS